MQSSIQWSIMLPIILQILQTAVIISATFVLLRKRKLLSHPIGAMDNDAAFLCASILFGVILISAGDAEHFFSAYKSTLTSGSVFKNTFAYFSLYFFTVVCAEVIFIVAVLVILEMLRLGNNKDKVPQADMPSAILCCGISVGLAFAINAVAGPIYNELTPLYFNFR